MVKLIDILTVEGSPTGITPLEIEGRGMGGAELALMRLADNLSQRGYIVRVFNDPREDFEAGNLSFRMRSTFNPDEYRDILITFRGPNPITLKSKKGLHIGFSCDQFTSGDYNKWYAEVDKMVLISEFHKQDHIKRYPGFIENKTFVTDLGVVYHEYNQNIDKVDKKVIFCSVPDRGLHRLIDIWPAIVQQVPDATLYITSDYRLWGVRDAGNMHYRLRFAGMPGVKFLGKISRNELVRHQLESEVHLYPCTYDENFCISCAETQSAGNYAITSSQGALSTTNFTGIRVDNDTDFIKYTVDFLKKSKSERMEIQKRIKEQAIERFNWNTIVDYWEKSILK